MEKVVGSGRDGYPGSRALTPAKAAAESYAEPKATSTRRTETLTQAPLLRSLGQSVPVVVRARRVP